MSVFFNIDNTCGDAGDGRARPAEMKSSAVQQGTVIGGGNALIFPEGPVDGQGRGITDEVTDFFQGRIRPL